jgi:undecaprenyl diphosphate synthase
MTRDAVEGTLDPEHLDESVMRRYLNDPDLPDPDLLIRTGGERRISNFLLWQLAYSELHFTEVFWPDFRRNHLYSAIEDFQDRERRFGRVDGSG